MLLWGLIGALAVSFKKGNSVGWARYGAVLLGLEVFRHGLLAASPSPGPALLALLVVWATLAVVVLLIWGWGKALVVGFEQGLATGYGAQLRAALAGASNALVA